MIGFICYVGSDHLCWIDHAVECRLVDMAELQCGLFQGVIDWARLAIINGL
jgi:hypothetical protein